MVYNYRCKKRLKSKDGDHCDTRITLKKKVGKYIRKPKCENCGAEITFHDKNVKKRMLENKCLCDGYHFPHANNSKWCIHYKGVLTDEDYENRKLTGD